MRACPTPDSQVLKEHFKNRVADKAWRVRIGCAECISDVAAACQSEPETQLPLQELYMALQKDHEQEVRVAASPSRPIGSHGLPRPRCV